MYNKSLNTVFIATLSLGIVMMVSSKTWFSVWLGLEINLLSFLPVILLASANTSEGGLKYFLIQAMGSLLILQTSFSWSMLPYSFMFFILPLTLKLGAAPLHFWLPDVTKTLPWRVNMILLTAQKMGPLYLLTMVSMGHKPPLLLISAASAVVGSLGGLNEMDLRKLMAFSSISHMGWVLASSTLSSAHWVMYFLTYVVTSLSLIIILDNMNMFSVGQLTSKNKSSLLTMLLFLSLGGLPPFLGFAPKWAILMSGASVSLALSVILVLTSMITLYYYIRTSLMTITLNAANFNMMVMMNNKFKTALIFASVMGGGVYMYMWSSLML
uniref:NADH-ubiquinone oxidoreductase chain 2 n=1 Tax=Proasellus cantabricus TaxID=1281948 RepID=A0A485M9Y2_9CRUS|nr:NADH dehydrogenase subunit 2 [Proasellus cantabricus]